MAMLWEILFVAGTSIQKEAMGEVTNDAPQFLQRID